MNAGRVTPLRWLVTMGVLAAITAGVVVVAALVGVDHVHLGAALSGAGQDHVILFDVRLPRIVLGLLVGAALGVSGATLQAVLENPLADPYILGVSGGAALGGTLALCGVAALHGIAQAGGALAPVAALAGHGSLGELPVSLFACLGALGAVALTVSVARSAGGIHPHSLLLSGVVFNAFAAAVILFLRTVVTEEKAEELLDWLMGSLGYRYWTWHEIAIVAVIVLFGTAFLLYLAPRLNLLAVGDAGASVLGIDVDRTRIVLVVATSLIVGTAVSVAGMVGFVGLMVPHMLRRIVGPDHRLLLPASVVGGAAFLVGSDLLARLLYLAFGTDFPVGVVTAFLGGPFFLLLMRRRPLAGGSA